MQISNKGLINFYEPAAIIITIYIAVVVIELQRFSEVPDSEITDKMASPT